MNFFIFVRFQNTIQMIFFYQKSLPFIQKRWRDSAISMVCEVKEKRGNSEKYDTQLNEMHKVKVCSPLVLPNNRLPLIPWSHNAHSHGAIDPIF